MHGKLNCTEVMIFFKLPSNVHYYYFKREWLGRQKIATNPLYTMKVKTFPTFWYILHVPLFPASQ